MRQIMNLRNLALLVVLAAGLMVVGSSNAQAGGYYGQQSSHGYSNYKSNCYYKTVVTYVSVRKPYVDYVTRYDHCGEAYVKKIVSYRTVQVPVYKKIKVCH